MSSFESKREFHALQPNEKADILFWVVMFRVKVGRYPTMAEVKAWWLSMSPKR